MKQIEESVALDSGEQTIRGHYVAQDANSASPVLIFAHGLGSTRQGEKSIAFAAECARRQWAFAAFDFHGHGESDGTMLDLRGSQLLSDLDAITAYLKKRGHQEVFIVGSSMGAWATTWFAVLHPQRVRACALIAPALRFLEWRRLSETALRQWQSQRRLRISNEWIDLELDYGLHAESGQYPYEQLCAQFAVPCLILHGMQDDTVPYAGSIDFIERSVATDIQLQLIKNGDHRLTAQKEMLVRSICDFFAAQLKQESSLPF